MVDIDLDSLRALQRPVVAVQGLGFVGAAMCAAVASSRTTDELPRYTVIGVDLPTSEGQRRIHAVNRGEFPFPTVDGRLREVFAQAHEVGNLLACNNTDVYGTAAVVIVDVHLDVQGQGRQASVDFTGFRQAIASIGAAIQPGSLVIVETTVPPGTCSSVVLPMLNASLRQRGLPYDSVLVAHSYERVMPGEQYFDSIVNYWRVYSGHTTAAGDACEAFLASIINVKDYPLTRLASTVASETAKVLENSFRAMTIAFMEEWGRFAEAAGFDLFQVVDAIRMRPSHSNMRTPGFGVGGYCLTKDPLLALVGARDFFQRSDLDFPCCRQAIETNSSMPLSTVSRLRAILGGLSGKRIILMGVSYRSGVADTRYSPSQQFVDAVRNDGAEVLCHDPLVGHWDELDEDVPIELPSASNVDAVVAAVAHPEYRLLDFAAWMSDAKPVVLDANGVFSDVQRSTLRALGCRVESIGRGDGL